MTDAEPVSAGQKAETTATVHGAGERPAKAIFEFALVFAGIFAALAIPSPGLGPLYVKAHAALGNALLPAALDSGVLLSFQATGQDLRQDPWRVTLEIEPPAPGVSINVPIDLRSLEFLPSAVYVALVVATPLGSPKRNAKLGAIGLLVLVPLLLGLVSLPVLSFLGGTGPVRAFSLPLWVHVLLQVLYRALVAPPGMAFALPLFVWWILMTWFRKRSEPVLVARSQG